MKTTGANSRKGILLIERLELIMFPVWFLLAIIRGGGYYVGFSAFFRPAWIRRGLVIFPGLRPLRCSAFPTSYFEIQRLATGGLNDVIYDGAREKEAAPLVRFLRRLCAHDGIETAFRRTFLDAYTLGRVKTLVFLRNLLEEGDVVLVPCNGLDPRPWAPADLAGAWSRARIPSVSRWAAAVADRLEPWRVVGVAFFVILGLIVQRGIRLTSPRVQRWAVGFDSFNEGLVWENPYHDSFLYAEGVLAPSSVLHVVRNRLKDKRTRRHFGEKAIPFVEASRLALPIEYLMHRVVKTMWGGFFLSALASLRREEVGPFFQAALAVVFPALIRGEVLELSHQTEVFVGRDEYGVTHILRTLLYDQRGGRTVGFNHGDDCVPVESNSYLSSHVFCLPGPFYRELLPRSTRFSGRVELIGMGLYGLDETHRWMTVGHRTEKYAALKECKLIGVFASSYHEDLFLTRENTLRFYKAAFSLASLRPEIRLIVRPKSINLEVNDPEFRRLMAEAGPQVLLEQDVWSYDLLTVLDFIVCISISTVGIEGLTAGIPVVYYDEGELRPHPYEVYDRRLVARTPEELQERVGGWLSKTGIIPRETLDLVRMRHGLAFDGKVVSRLRGVVEEALRNARTNSIFSGDGCS
jgi:hypothetical protein